MKILLDECVDRRLARLFGEHLVSTVPRIGWAGIKNGELLGLAEKEFDVLLTVDRKISTQQSLTKLTSRSFSFALPLIAWRTFARFFPEFWRHWNGRTLER